MRFMVLVKANKDTEAGVMPSEKLLTEMGKFNEELVKAGVMLAGEGLHPSSKGARVRFSGDKRTVIDGPFTETKELIAGFWLWQVKSKEEAIEWVKRCPNPMTGESEIEIRQVFEADGLRPGAHARAAGAGGAPARAGRGDAAAQYAEPRPARALAPAAEGALIGRRDGYRHRIAPIDAVWRIESARLIAGLARIVRDVGLAEELAQDALVAALEQWPESGVPDNPGAWLMATAKHRAIDLLRRSKRLERKHEELGHELEAAAGAGRAGSRRRARRRRRRRPPAPRLHGLPPGALDRGARRAHAAPARRPDDRGDRARVPRPGADRRPAHRARQADARRGARPVRGPARRRARRPPVVGARGHLPRLQRGLLGDRRRRLDAARALRGRAAPRPHPGRARARRSRRSTASSR